MSTTPSSQASRSPAHLAGLLTGPELRRDLEALLRRRVPLQEVDDVAQTVLAEALASDSVPRDPGELRRWLNGIARHKIADFHRRRARALDQVPPSNTPFREGVAAAPAAFEEREVLNAVLGEERTEREAEAMNWLVREHAGERFADIAAEEGVPAPVVRQRVSRLRRALRSRWFGLLALVALIGGGTALGLAARDAREARAGSSSAGIDPDPVLSSKAPVPLATPTDLAKLADGDWWVHDVKPYRPLLPFEESLVEHEAKNARLTVRGKRILLEAAGGTFTTSWKVTHFAKTEGGAKITLQNETGPVSTADVTYAEDASGPRLEVTLHDPRYGGHVTLRRTPVR